MRNKFFSLSFRGSYFKMRLQHLIRRTNDSPDLLVAIGVWVINNSKLDIATVVIFYNGPSLCVGKRCRKVALTAILCTGKRDIKDDQCRTCESWFQLHECRDTDQNPNKTEQKQRKTLIRIRRKEMQTVSSAGKAQEKRGKSFGKWSAQVANVFGFASCWL